MNEGNEVSNIDYALRIMHYAFQKTEVLILCKTYTTIQGDMWDSIARKLYGKEGYEDVLITANIQYRNIHIFPSGIVLSVPQVDTRKVSGTSVPWRRKT